jgi:hypothetical protein
VSEIHGALGVRLCPNKNTNKRRRNDYYANEQETYGQLEGDVGEDVDFDGTC